MSSEFLEDTCLYCQKEKNCCHCEESNHTIQTTSPPSTSPRPRQNRFLISMAIAVIVVSIFLLFAFLIGNPLKKGAENLEQ